VGEAGGTVLQQIRAHVCLVHVRHALLLRQLAPRLPPPPLAGYAHRAAHARPPRFRGRGARRGRGGRRAWNAAFASSCRAAEAPPCSCCCCCSAAMRVCGARGARQRCGGIRGKGRVGRGAGERDVRPICTARGREMCVRLVPGWERFGEGGLVKSLTCSICGSSSTLEIFFPACAPAAVNGRTRRHKYTQRIPKRRLRAPGELTSYKPSTTFSANKGSANNRRGAECSRMWWGGKVHHRSSCEQRVGRRCWARRVRRARACARAALLRRLLQLRLEGAGGG
jgi:hypothetical protein